jgi:hypothetical protein
VALGADGLGKQILLRRVVHVDVVLVGEQEFHHTKHIGRSGRLIDVEAADIDAAPVELRRIDFSSADGDAQAVPREDRGIIEAAAKEPSAAARDGG